MYTFENIIGYDCQKNDLKTICDILKKPDKYKSLGLRSPHALMIYGDPGLGKTLMAKALIDESERPYFQCTKSKGKNDFNQDIKETFEKASAAAPSIVFLDDIDKFAEDNLDSNCNKEEFATIQACLEDISNIDVFVLATANNTNFLPDSLMRPGRFGRKIYVGPPSEDDFIKIAKKLLEKVNTLDKDLPEYITKLINGLSPALLEEVINEAGIHAAFHGEAYITKSDVLQAVLNVVYSMREQCNSSKFHSNKEKQKLVAYHEAGHAVIATIVGKALSIISTVSVGLRGGVCMFNPAEVKDVTFEDTEKTILTLLGGRAAVEMILGSKENGASDDFAKAHELIRVSCEKQIMYGFEFGYDLDRWDERGSNKRKNEISQKMTNLLNEYYKSACNIIEDHKDLVEAIAEELIEKDFLTFEDIDRIVNARKR